MKQDNNEEANNWYAQAVQDLDDVKFNLSGKRYNVACFLCQQADEKALKAFLFFNKAEEVWGHSVADLYEDASQFEKEFIKLKEDVAPLDKYYIPTRYPDALPGGIPSKAFNENDVHNAILLTEKTIDFVKLKCNL